MGAVPELIRCDPLQPRLNLVHRLAGREAGAVRDPEDMCVDSDGRLAEGLVQHDIGRLAPHAG